MSDNIMAYNGGCVVAMIGKNCFGIASDRRFGVRQQTLSCDFERIFKINDRTFIGLTGLTTDVQTFAEKLAFRVNMYKLREEREITPRVLASLVSNMLYERRFGPYFVEPVIIGLEADDQPFVAATDLIGAACFPGNFSVGGTCSESLYGMCESLWQPDMEADDLFESLSQALLASVDRDCLSGWGGVVHIVTPEKITTKYLKGRMD
nr:proteasome subunit beta type-3 [Seculamonas ecuadoriensis]